MIPCLRIICSEVSIVIPLLCRPHCYGTEESCFCPSSLRNRSRSPANNPRYSSADRRANSLEMLQNHIVGEADKDQRNGCWEHASIVGTWAGNWICHVVHYSTHGQPPVNRIAKEDLIYLCYEIAMSVGQSLQVAVAQRSMAFTYPWVCSHFSGLTFKGHLLLKSKCPDLKSGVVTLYTTTLNGPESWPLSSSFLFPIWHCTSAGCRLQLWDFTQLWLQWRLCPRPWRRIEVHIQAGRDL